MVFSQDDDQPLDDTGDSNPGNILPGTTGGGEAPPPAPTGADTPPDPAGGGGGGGGGGGMMAGAGARPDMNFRPVPRFDAPEFAPPDPNKLFETPGFRFRQQAGEDALQRSAASRGVLRTGGTLKDLLEYGQNFASNEYQQEFNRALATFQTQYTGAKDEYAPLLAEWQTLSNAELQAALAAYNRTTVWNAPKGGGGGGTPMLPAPTPGDYGL